MDIERIHVFPLERDHEMSPHCWCEPALDYVDPDSGNEVYVHREIQ